MEQNSPIFLISPNLAPQQFCTWNAFYYINYQFSFQVLSGSKVRGTKITNFPNYSTLWCSSVHGIYILLHEIEVIMYVDQKTATNGLAKKRVIFVRGTSKKVSECIRVRLLPS